MRGKSPSRTELTCAIALLVCIGLAAGDARAADDEVEDVVVTGLRASLLHSSARKENAEQIEDSVVAGEVGKLPDADLAEAMQRIAGVQITRDLGDGSAVSVRGLSQVETTLDNREVFTASGGRTLNFEDIPSGLLAGVDVYKAQSANLIEGGIGASIDIRTHRPFDFAGLELDAGGLANYGGLSGKAGGSLSGLVSDRWTTAGGEFGALASLAYQDRRFQEDYISSSAPVTAAYGGQTMVLPGGNYDLTYTGERRRLGLNAAFQWQPRTDLEVYADSLYARVDTQQMDYGNGIALPASPSPIGALATTRTGDITLFQSGSFANASLTTFGIYRDVVDVNQQYGVGAKWNAGPLRIASDLSYSPTSEDLYYTELDAHATVPVWTSGVQGPVPTSLIGGLDAADPAAYRAGGLTYSVNHWTGHETALRIDAEYAPDDGLIGAFDVGTRYARSRMGLAPIRYHALLSPQGIGAFPNLYMSNPAVSMFTAGEIGRAAELRVFPLADPRSLRDISSVFAAAGLGSASLSTAPLSTFDVDEETRSAYALAKVETVAGIAVDGNLGGRFIQTEDTLSGNAGISSTSYTSIGRAHHYADFLPSANFRLHLADDTPLYLRASYSRSLTRPDFASLSPSATLLPGNSTGTQGNPDLTPATSDNTDLSLEWYRSPDESLSVGLFHKAVNGFLLTRSRYETFDGQSYLVSQPVNSGHGVVEGGEVGYQQFLKFLGGAFSNFGVQATFTYASSKVPTTIDGISAPLSNLSKTSYNLIGLYEDGRVSTRLAYNWRSSFLSGVDLVPGIGVEPVYTNAYGWLDAIFSYALTDQVSFTVEGNNLLGTMREGFYQIPGGGTLPSFRAIDDRQISAGFRLKL